MFVGVASEYGDDSHNEGHDVEDQQTLGDPVEYPSSPHIDECSEERDEVRDKYGMSSFNCVVRVDQIRLSEDEIC